MSTSYTGPDDGPLFRARDPRAATQDAAAHARTTDPLTSHQAARSMAESGALSSQAQATLDDLREYVRLWGSSPTAAELAGADGPKRIMYNRRLADLADKYQVVRRCTARTCRILGSNCTTWEPV